MSATFAPYVVALRRRGWGRAKAAGVVTLGAVLIIVGIVVVIIIAFVPQIASTINAARAGLEKVQAVAADASPAA